MDSQERTLKGRSCCLPRARSLRSSLTVVDAQPRSLVPAGAGLSPAPAPGCACCSPAASRSPGTTPRWDRPWTGISGSRHPVTGDERRCRAVMPFRRVRRVSCNRSSGAPSLALRGGSPALRIPHLRDWTVPGRTTPKTSPGCGKVAVARQRRRVLYSCTGARAVRRDNEGRAPVAQRIERLVADQKVGGSSPSGRTGQMQGQRPALL